MRKCVMSIMKEITIAELMALPREKFIQRNLEYIKEARGGNLMEVSTPDDCPLALWVAYNDKKCNRQQVSNTAECPLCGNPVCPDCMNHVVEQLSRVTGYLSNVSSWGAAKQQEFKDRQRHNL